jgi:hypothetical protein
MRRLIIGAMALVTGVVAAVGLAVRRRRGRRDDVLPLEPAPPLMPASPSPAPKRRRPRRKPGAAVGAATATATSIESGPSPAIAGEPTPAPKRRRRRKPAARTTDSPDAA